MNLNNKQKEKIEEMMIVLEKANTETICAYVGEHLSSIESTFTGPLFSEVFTRLQTLSNFCGSSENESFNNKVSGYMTYLNSLLDISPPCAKAFMIASMLLGVIHTKEPKIICEYLSLSKYSPLKTTNIHFLKDANSRSQMIFTIGKIVKDNCTALHKGDMSNELFLDKNKEWASIIDGYILGNT